MAFVCDSIASRLHQDTETTTFPGIVCMYVYIVWYGFIVVLCGWSRFRAQPLGKKRARDVQA